MESWTAHHLICSPQTTGAQRAEEEEGGNSQQQGNNFRPHLNSYSEGSLVLIAQLQHALSARAKPLALGHEWRACCIHLLNRKNARLRGVDYFSSCSEEPSHMRARGSRAVHTGTHPLFQHPKRERRICSTG
jgi:hypothetical protein